MPATPRGRPGRLAWPGLSPILIAWLRMCKGAAIGPSGLFGARPDDGSLDLVIFPFERELGDRRWPFDAAAVLHADPRLADGPNDLLPWQTT